MVTKSSAGIHNAGRRGLTLVEDHGLVWEGISLHTGGVVVEIPEQIAQLLPSDPAGRERRVLEGLVIGAYTSGTISRGRAFELLGLDHWSGESFFRRRGVALNYDLEEFRRDLGA